MLDEGEAQPPPCDKDILLLRETRELIKHLSTGRHPCKHTLELWAIAIELLKKISHRI